MRNLTVLLKPAGGLCNLSCDYCFYKSSHGGRIMSDDVYRRLIDACFEYADTLNLALQGGEPLLCGADRLSAMFAYARSRGNVHLSLQTNGTLIDDDIAALLREYRVLVGVSLDGPRDLHDKYRTYADGRGSYADVLRGIGYLDKHKVDYNILCVVTADVARRIKSVYAWYKKQGHRYIQYIPVMENKNAGIRLSDKHLSTFLRDSYAVWRDDLLRGNYISVRHLDNYGMMLQGRPPESCAMSGVCGHYIVVEHDGMCYPCDFYVDEAHLLGNIADHSIDALLSCDTARAFVESSKILPEKCRNCRYASLCRNGCAFEREGGLRRNCAIYGAFFDYMAPELAAILKKL